MVKYFRACKAVSVGCFLTGACMGTLCVLVTYYKLTSISAAEQVISTNAGGEILRGISSM